jgi:mannan endo-1,4-beta-mannosidase
VFEGPNLLNRGDPCLADAMEATRKASLHAGPEPVTEHASEQAQALLERLYAVSGQSTLSGQENDARAVLGSTEHVIEVTGQSPAIYGEDLGITKEDGLPVEAVRRAIVEEAKRQSKSHAMVSLSWHAARPTDDEPAALEQSVRGQLTDFEWNELLTPGTDLYKRWCRQVDEVAKYLAELQDAKVPVLWRPYPEANGKKFWWAGRKGLRGSAALYRQLFDRLVNQDGLHNLIWVWNAAPPGFGPNATGAYADYFPGMLYVDALALNVENPNSRFRLDSALSLTGGGKVIGIGFAGKIPDPSWFRQQTGWSWFLVAPEPALPAAAAAASAEVPPASSAPPESAADRAETLRKLYADPRVVPKR